MKLVSNLCFPILDESFPSFKFSALFSEAWSKGMSISNFVAGFRCTGTYPFNPNAILEKISGNSAAIESQTPVLSSPEPTSSVELDSINFSTDEFQLFENRFENGYNI